MKKRKPHAHRGPRPHGQRPIPRPKSSANELWLYGLHAARAALANPQRRKRRAVLTERAAAEIGRAALGGTPVEIVEAEVISHLLAPGSVHQGVALQCDSLPQLSLDKALAREADRRRIVVVLDQVTDPHNVGAILRSCAAFGVTAVIVQDRHAPPESGVLAKAASGALDRVPYVVTVNIARALEELGRMGFWRIALAGDGDVPLKDAASTGDIALALGAEGAGLRRLVRERCDVSACIPIPGAMESLNVSNAAAIALYELSRA